jgi:WD40 repeat protein
MLIFHARRRLRGGDAQWRHEGTAQLDAAVTSLTLDAEGAELIAATRAGSVYRILLDDLSSQQLSAAHTAPITALAAGPSSSAFAAASSDGVVRIWDLCGYHVVATVALPLAARKSSNSSRNCSSSSSTSSSSSSAKVRCLCWIKEQAVVSGWADGAVRCSDAVTGVELWSIAAHRGAVTAVAVHTDAALAYLATGELLITMCDVEQTILCMFHQLRALLKV